MVGTKKRDNRHYFLASCPALVPATSSLPSPMSENSLSVPTIVPIILAGGKGERFWPLSRRDRPKQFLCLDGSGRSLLQATVDRLAPLADQPEDVRIVAGPHLSQMIRDQLPELPETSLLVEPEGRDTAPALAWASLVVAERYGPETVLGFFPADHWIGDRPAFERTIQAAAALAVAEGAIVTLGIAPTSPATGYGYIERGEPVGPTPSATEANGLQGYRVARFTEKPDRATAEAFLASGRFSWNSGMFVFQAQTVLAELARHAPEILEPLRSQGTAAYPNLPKMSIDYALMEKTDRACVMPAQFGWDDLGDWTALDRLAVIDANNQDGQDTQDQTTTSQADRSAVPEAAPDVSPDVLPPNVELGQHVGLDTAGTIIFSSNSDDLIATIGLQNLVIVRDGNITLVAEKSRIQEIKTLLKQLQSHPDWRDRL